MVHPDEVKPTTTTTAYANRHIPAFLALPLWQPPSAVTAAAAADNDDYELIQVVDDGRILTADNLMQKQHQQLSLHRPILVRDTPESIGMRLPRKKKTKQQQHAGSSGLSIRDIADIVGHATPIHAIDVEFQEELEGWTFYDLVEYFEDEDRIQSVAARQKQQQQQQQTTTASSTMPASTTATTTKEATTSLPTMSTTAANATTTSTTATATPRLPRRAAAMVAATKTKQEHRVINQISYEFSHTPLAELVLSPTFVRQLDWIDTVWPATTTTAATTPTKNDTTMSSNNATNQQQELVYPVVQYYCLTSAGGCYTDFHIDFGGTSVWYHVLSGAKEFCLIAPTRANLQAYENWLCRADQSLTFLVDMLPEKEENVIRLRLEQHQTMIIPAGWIHAVYTPVDSLVFGGNFLHGLDMNLQMQVYSIEVRTKVLERFRFPHFLPLQYYAVGAYLRKLRAGDVCQREVEELGPFLETMTAYWSAHKHQQEETPAVKNSISIHQAAEYASKMNHASSFDDVLMAVKFERERILREGISPVVPGNSDAEPVEKVLSPQSGPKIRLKLGCLSKSKVCQTPVISKEETSKSDTAFRITLSSTTTQSFRPPPPDIPFARTKAREDMSAFVDETELAKDEEWVPTSAATTTTLPLTSVTTFDTGGCVSGKRKEQSSGKKTVAKKAKTTSRQRLLKKVK